MLDRSLVFLDLETTGATASFDRITEIGLIEVERGSLVGEWSMLVNPQARIPPFIEALTGISNDMVALAPTFAEVAPGLKARLEGKLLVAHNARFDYGFLKQEFRRLDMKFASDVVCTVKLSRKLFPGHARHNLDSLMERHGVACGARHRALGDARVLWELAQIWRGEFGDDALAAAAAAQIKSPTLPPGLSALVLDEIPETPGVYLFYGENDLPIYVGKSVNLRLRVLAHFSGDHRLAKDMRIVQQVKRIDWQETAGELGALIEEARLVKQLLPTLNRQLRRNNDWYAFAWDPAQRQALQLISGADVDFRDTSHVYGLFRTGARRSTPFAIWRRRAVLIATGLEKAPAPFRIRSSCRAYAPARIPRPARPQVDPPSDSLQAWPPGRIGVCEARRAHRLHVLDHWRRHGARRARTARA